MSSDRLHHILDLLEDGTTLPAPTRDWLRDGLRRWAGGQSLELALGLDAATARRERDQVLRDNAATIPAASVSARARAIANEARRIHRGRRTAYDWIRRADRIATLPETSRQILNILGK